MGGGYFGMEESVTMVTQFINAVGFPVFVAVFCLFKLDKTIKENTSIMTKLVESISKSNTETKAN